VVEEREAWPPPGERVRSESPREYAASGREVDFFLPVVCTDRGQHRPTRLTTVIRELDGELHMARALEAFVPPMGPDAKPRSLMSQNAYVFICRRCGRTPSVEKNRWWNLALRHARTGTRSIDVSHLD
jgi:hypothetical protein